MILDRADDHASPHPGDNPDAAIPVELGESAPRGACAGLRTTQRGAQHLNSKKTRSPVITLEAGLFVECGCVLPTAARSCYL
ncbi:hypothetical protein [Natronoglycomyces albus]|uniref:Uncharacterized protein n=1 Tax=Natronoglycomyces albus TaxID=2811108 RepID=A0A895XPH0_9ACTN|nr:hypothetical protein [Natronoglycomyces albus]QSB05642.1 hypothetical protein JQS30_01555 [Natronoglycomyces albus]